MLSLSMVDLIFSDPGVIKNCDFDINPFSSACFAILEALDISSYDELVQLPINADFNSFGYPFSVKNFLKSDILVEISLLYDLYLPD
jgi:hypothetical protein